MAENVVIQCYTTSSTGRMSTRGLSTSLVWWCTGVSMTGRLGTSLITSSQPLILLLAVFVYDPLTWIVSLSLAADLARTAVGQFITLVRQYGTRCQTNVEALTVLTALNDSWKQFFSAVTSVTSALEMRYINLRFIFIFFTYLLTYCVSTTAHMAMSL